MQSVPTLYRVPILNLSLFVCLLGFYGISTFVAYLMPNSSLYKWTVLIQIIQFSISIVFIHTQLSVKTVLFQTIQFSISPIWAIDRTLSDTTTPGQSGPGSDGNERVLCIPQHYWSLTIRLFSVISKTFVVGGNLTLLQKCSQYIL